MLGGRLQPCLYRTRNGRVTTPDAQGRRYFLVHGKRYYAGDTLPDGSMVRGTNQFPYRVGLALTDKDRDWLKALRIERF
jgi:hypothetical protein